jgi:hypothetical protein
MIPVGCCILFFKDEDIKRKYEMCESYNYSRKFCNSAQSKSIELYETFKTQIKV